MKSFKQYISENWSYAQNREWESEDAGKYIFHVTHADRAKQIVDQGKLIPSSIKKLQPHIDEFERIIERRKTMGMYGDLIDLGKTLNILKRRTTNVFFSRGDVGDEGQSTSAWSRGGVKGSTVLKFPIANIPRNLARRFEVDVPGSEVANREDKSRNPSAITIRGSFPK